MQTTIEFSTTLNKETNRLDNDKKSDLLRSVDSPRKSDLLLNKKYSKLVNQTQSSDTHSSQQSQQPGLQNDTSVEITNADEDEDDDDDDDLFGRDEDQPIDEDSVFRSQAIVEFSEIDSRHHSNNLIQNDERISLMQEPNHHMG